MKKRKKSNNQGELPLGDVQQRAVKKKAKKSSESDRRIPGFDLLVLVCKIYDSKFGMTTDEMAEAVGISERHARRHIKDLDRIPGFCEAEITRNGKTVYLFNRDKRFGDGITEGLFSMFDLLGFATIRDFYEQHPSTSIPVPIRKALERVESGMTPELRETYEKMRDFCIHKRPPVSDYSKKTHIIEGILRAIRNTKVLEIGYDSENSKTRRTRTIHPYHMVSSDGFLYVVAYDPEEHKSPKFKMFKIDRIYNLKAIQEPFQPHFDFDVIKHLSTSFGIYTGPVKTIVAVFDDTVATLIREKMHHASQEHEDLPGKRLKATWTIEWTVQFKSWLMGFGSHVEILEPKEVREEIMAELKSMIKVYNLAAVGENPANMAAVRGTRDLGDEGVPMTQ